MAASKRERFLENLALASVLGFLAFVVGAIRLAADASSASAERAAFAQPGMVVELASHSDDPSFNRVFSIRSDSTIAYGAVLSFRAHGSSALVAAQFSPKAEMQGLRLLGSCSPRLASGEQDLMSEFPGSAAALSRAAETVREISGSEPRS